MVYCMNPLQAGTEKLLISEYLVIYIGHRGAVVSSIFSFNSNVKISLKYDNGYDLDNTDIRIFSCKWNPTDINISSVECKFNTTTGLSFFF